MVEVTSGLSDVALLLQVREGDTQSLEVLLGRYYHLVFAYAFRMCGGKEDAEEITQETLLKVARSIKAFKGQSKFTTWLYRITANATSDWMKKKTRNRKGLEEYVEETKHENKTDSSQSREILEALGKLSCGEREAIVLTFYEGMTHGETAKILRCAETTVSWRVFMAKKKLKTFLTESDEQ